MIIIIIINISCKSIKQHQQQLLDEQQLKNSIKQLKVHRVVFAVNSSDEVHDIFLNNKYYKGYALETINLPSNIFNRVIVFKVIDLVKINMNYDSFMIKEN